MENTPPLFTFAAIFVLVAASILSGNLGRLITVIASRRRLRRPINPGSRIKVRFAFVVAVLALAVFMPFVWFLASATVGLWIYFLLIGVGVVLFQLCIFDARYLWLPNTLTLALGASGLLHAAQSNFFNDALWGMAAGFGVFYLLQQFYLKVRRMEAIGSGDVKLSAAMGAWLGLGYWPPAILGASVLALIVIGASRLAGLSGSGAKIPFGLYLSLSLWGFLLLRLNAS